MDAIADRAVVLAVIGIVAVGVLILGGIVGLFWWLLRRK